MEKKEKQKTRLESTKTDGTLCKDKLCPFHGTLSLRGRNFHGQVIKKFPKRVVLTFERRVYIRKYERYLKRRVKIHARLPDCLQKEIDIGDYVQGKECRPLSRMIHFVAIKKIRGGETK
jgi:small subunit ribosomal protein S17